MSDDFDDDYGEGAQYASPQEHASSPVSSDDGSHYYTVAVPDVERDFDPLQFSGAFWSVDGTKPMDAGIEEIKKHLALGSDFSRDIIAVFKERLVLSLFVFDDPCLSFLASRVYCLKLLFLTILSCREPLKGF